MSTATTSGFTPWSGRAGAGRRVRGHGERDSTGRRRRREPGSREHPQPGAAPVHGAAEEALDPGQAEEQVLHRRRRSSWAGSESAGAERRTGGAVEQRPGTATATQAASGPRGGVGDERQGGEQQRVVDDLGGVEPGPHERVLQDGPAPGAVEELDHGPILDHVLHRPRRQLDPLPEQPAAPSAPMTKSSASRSFTGSSPPIAARSSRRSAIDLPITTSRPAMALAAAMPVATPPARCRFSRSAPGAPLPHPGDEVGDEADLGILEACRDLGEVARARPGRSSRR